VEIYLSHEKGTFHEYREITMAQYKRQTAHITNIVTLLSSHFVKGEAQMLPSYVATKKGIKIGRAHLIAVIVAKELNVQSEATIDDGTGKIVARSFENPDFFSGIALGDIVRIIGKVRAFNEQIYLIPEVVKKIQNKGWVRLHKLQLDGPGTVSEVAVPEIGQEEEVTIENVDPIDADDTQPESPVDDILRVIKEKDMGDGVPIELVIADAGDSAEKIIQNLLETGEIFEIRPGRIKVLE
jgi:hypothetical protein